MKNWLLAILAVVVGILGLAYVNHVDTSREALRVMTEAREALQRCDNARRQAALDAPPPAPAPTLEDAGRRSRTIAADARRYNVDLGPKEARIGEAAKRECELEAERLGRAAALWCAGQ